MSIKIGNDSTVQYSVHFQLQFHIAQNVVQFNERIPRISTTEHANSSTQFQQQGADSDSTSSRCKAYG